MLLNCEEIDPHKLLLLACIINNVKAFKLQKDLFTYRMESLRADIYPIVKEIH